MTQCILRNPQNWSALFRTCFPCTYTTANDCEQYKLKVFLCRPTATSIKKEVSSMFVSFWGEWECDHAIHIFTSSCSICSRFSSEFPVSLKLLLLKHSDGKFALWLKLPDGFMRRICRVALALMFLINIKTTQDAQPLMLPTKPTSPISFFEKYKMKLVRN